MLVRKDKKNSHSGGFLSGAKTSKKAPYSETPRSPDMYHLGTESNFIIPQTQEKLDKVPKGIKR